MNHWSATQQVLRWLTRAVLHIALRPSFHGLEHIVSTGPVVIAFNHLHIVDGLLLFSILPMKTVFLVTDKFRRTPAVSWYIRLTGAIFIKRGAADRQALKQAIGILRSGGVIGIAPEGRVSSTGGLTEAQPGIGSFVTHCSCSVLPVAICGQYRAHFAWMRLRRPRVRVRFGSALSFDDCVSKGSANRLITEKVMRELAELLPEDHRGIYANKGNAATEQEHERVAICVSESS
jgi:1-acyl-sn-glycerol-3-phosphate acyltransferase